MQFVTTWLTGSLTLGSLALTLLSGWPPESVRTAPSLAVGERALAGLLLLAMMSALLIIGWRTADASWLGGGPRGAVLWAAVVGGFGFAGWIFAGVVTVVAGFSHGAKVTLAYTGGGLPLALVAGLLQRPMRVNAVAAGLVAAALVAGVLVAGIGLFPLLGICFSLLSSIFNPFVFA